MDINASQNNKRIAKNTLLLYIRTLLVMCISLYTSRVVLNTLGISDFGIYNVVGGTVAMFSVISGSLSSSISRFITYALGKGDISKLSLIFSTSLNIQFVLSLFIFLLGEIIGLWFLNNKMNIPVDRIYAANWVLQFALLTFVINLISIPYNSIIIAHEKMSAFAYVSILEVSLKLLIVYVLFLTSVDKLIAYSFLLVLVAVVIRVTYGIYCSKQFKECRYKFVYDKDVLREMIGFAGWSFFSNSAFIFNTQGINILINLFFGVAVNSARGIATQVESAIMRFINDFTTAINPQITKSYASGDFEYLYKLICSGAKYSFFLMLFLTLPFMLETPIILKLWLNIVPEHTVAFFRLSIIGSMCNLLSNTSYTACLATGNIRKYVIIVTSIGCLVFPLSWLFFKFGAPVETTYLVFIVIYLILLFVRIPLLKRMVGLPPKQFLKDVILKVLLVSISALVLPSFALFFLHEGFIRLILSAILSAFSSLSMIYLLGLSSPERTMVRHKIINIIRTKL